MTTITLRTNYNNKLGCTCFCHIDAAPEKKISERELSSEVYEIKTIDNSHPPVQVRLQNLLRLPLDSLSDSLTWPSHGMNSNDYYDWIMRTKPNYKSNEQMAVYFYKRE